MGELQVQVVTVHDGADAEGRAYARRKIGQLAKFAPGPVLLARVMLDRAPDPARERPALAAATLDVNGRLICARVAAEQLNEAVDLLEARLRHRLEHVASQRRARQRRATTGEAGQRRHRARGARRPARLPQPDAERAVVRHQPLAPARMPLREAALELELLGYGFHLFVEASTGQDALLWRQPDGGLGLAVAGERLVDTTGCALPVQPAPAPPRLTEEAATRRLDLAGEPFVFFVDAMTGRGAVAYRRHDGHDGLITLAWRPPGP